jgi:hypothetical protein
MKPFLGAVCPILIVPEIGREFVDPVIGGSKLQRHGDLRRASVGIVVDVRDGGERNKLNVSLPIS